MDESNALVLIVLMFALVLIAGIASGAYTAHENNIKDQKFVSDCLDKHGSIAYTDDYKMKCLLPKAT